MWAQRMIGAVLNRLPHLGYVVAALFALLPVHSVAQSYVSTATSTINDNTLCPGATNIGSRTPAYVTRTFNISGLPNVSDLNVGLIATHSWRGDMRIQLISPLGTTRTLTVEDTAASGNLDDYNILFDDEAAVTVNTGSHAVANNVSVSPYQYAVRPDNTLSVFDGTNPNGTWTLRICDDYAGENGQLIRAELIFEQPGTGDLELDIAASNTLPQYNGTITVDYTLSNDGPETQTGVTVDLGLPSDVTINSTSGPGTVSGSIWTAPNLTSGSSVTMSLNLTVGTSTAVFDSEVLTASEPDPDSSPGNGPSGEDDEDSVTVFPQPPATPPSLSCPVTDQYVLDWSAPGTSNGWDAGDLTNSYAADANDAGDSSTIPVSLTLTGNTGSLGQVDGANSPVTQTTYNGALTGETLLGIGVDFPSVSNSVTMNMSLGIAGEGVDGVQFLITDVDFGGWIDRLTVSASLDGTPVTDPSLTPSTNNYVAGNQVIGRNGNAGASSAAGNVTITFDTPIDTLSIVYDNDPSVGSNPAFQIIAISDINLCPRLLPDITAVKTVEVYDPGGLGLFMTPGNEVLYRITVNNSATATKQADDIDLTDTLPDGLTFITASASGFTAGSLTGLPTANTDCTGGSCVINFENGELPIDQSGEVTVRALIQ